MSTTAEFVDPERLEEAMRAIRDDKDPTNWLLASHVDNLPTEVDVLGMGSSGLDELVSLLDDQQVQYALVRIEEEIDMSVTTKFVYIHWMGQGVGFAARGRFGVVAGSVQAIFQPFHMSIDTSNVDELTEENVIDALAQQSGKKNKVLDAEVADSRQGHERSYTGATSRTSGQKTGMAPQVSLQGAEVSCAEDLSDILEEVRNGDNPINCVALHYPENNIKKGLHLLHRGDDGFQGLAEHIADDSALFALMCVTDVVDDIPTVKYIQITWVGERVKPMAKAKIATQKGDIARILGSAHISVHASHRSEISERAIMDRVMAASGSRKV